MRVQEHDEAMQKAMPVNIPQKAFLIRLVVVVIASLAGLLLMFIADSRISDMETTADMNTFSWLNTSSGLMFLAASIMSIVTLRYGRNHEAAIREHATVSILLTAYRILFWLACITTLLAVAFLIWLGLHIGPVR